MTLSRLLDIIISFSAIMFNVTGAVHLCALENDWSTLQELLKAGASPNLQDGRGRTVAMIAAQYGHVQVMKLLDNDLRKVNMKLKVSSILTVRKQSWSKKLSPNLIRPKRKLPSSKTYFPI